MLVDSRIPQKILPFTVEFIVTRHNCSGLAHVFPLFEHLKYIHGRMRHRCTLMHTHIGVDALELLAIFRDELLLQGLEGKIASRRAAILADSLGVAMQLPIPAGLRYSLHHLD